MCSVSGFFCSTWCLCVSPRLLHVAVIPSFSPQCGEVRCVNAPYVTYPSKYRWVAGKLPIWGYYKQCHMNILLTIFGWTEGCISGRDGIAGSQDMCTFPLNRWCQVMPQHGQTNLHSHWQCVCESSTPPLSIRTNMHWVRLWAQLWPPDAHVEALIPNSSECVCI